MTILSFHKELILNNNAAKPPYPPETIAEVLSYNPVNGRFSWKVRRGSTMAGASAGTICRGIKYIAIDRAAFKATRIANYLTTGSWDDMKHIDGDKTDFSWANLQPIKSTQTLGRYIQCFETDDGWKVVSNVNPEFIKTLEAKLEGLPKS